MGQLLQSVISAPVSSTIRGLSTEVRLGSADGIHIESVANLDNVQLVARARLVRRVGRASPTVMNAICTALSTAVSCR